VNQALNVTRMKAHWYGRVSPYSRSHCPILTPALSKDGEGDLRMSEWLRDLGYVNRRIPVNYGDPGITESRVVKIAVGATNTIVKHLVSC